MPDVQINGAGGLYEVTLRTPRAARWVARRVSTEPWQWITADTFACDDRGFMDGIVRAMRAAGLAVE